MKQYNFDEVIERRGTNCVKYDAIKERYGNENLIPLWVADRDFRDSGLYCQCNKETLRHRNIRLYFQVQTRIIIVL